MNEWRKNELPLICGPSRRITPRETPSTPPSASRGVVPQTPPPSGGLEHLRSIPKEDLEDFLKCPHTLVGWKFMSYSPRVDYEGAWTVVSFTVQMVNNEADHEYQVLMENFMQSPLPMDIAEVRHLLEHSKYNL